jgi:hypothetical protein
MIYFNAATGTASYTFPTPFVNMPVVFNETGTVTALTTIAVTVTGASSTGFIFLEGY